MKIFAVFSAALVAVGVQAAAVQDLNDAWEYPDGSLAIRDAETEYPDSSHLLQNRCPTCRPNYCCPTGTKGCCGNVCIQPKRNHCCKGGFGCQNGHKCCYVGCCKPGLNCYYSLSGGYYYCAASSRAADKEANTADVDEALVNL